MRHLLIFFTIILFASCEKEEEEQCLGNQVCTFNLVAITVQILDQNGDPVILDNYYTFIDQRNRFEFTDDSSNTADGFYIVATDNEMPEIDFNGTNVVFVGELDGVNVVEQPLILGKDCCHIELIQGETEIQIEL